MLTVNSCENYRQNERNKNTVSRIFSSSKIRFEWNHKTPSSVQNCYEVEFTGIKQKFDHRESVKKGLGRIFTHSETSLAVFFYAMLSISLRTTWIA